MKDNRTDKQLQLNSVCFFCWGLIGDVFFRVPVIELFKKYYPEARITCLVDPVGEQVLKNHPDIDEVFVFSRDKSKKVMYIINSVLNIINLRRKKFDLSINLYSGGSSPLLSRLINASIRLGFDHSRALRNANTLSANHPSFCQHWSVALAHIYEPLGIDPRSVRRGTSFYFSQRAEARATEILNNRRCIVINTGSGQRGKQWPIESYVRLTEYISSEYDVFPLIITNPNMEYLTERFKQLYDSNFEFKILPVLNLDIVGAILKQSIALVTGDTSIMHLAFGVKCPTQVIFTATRPEIVEPEDCLYVPSFIENKNDLNTCGKPSGSIDLSVEHASLGFRDLYGKLPRQHKIKGVPS